MMTETNKPSTSSANMSSSLPSEFYLLKMIESRSLEVNALNIECKTKSPKLWSQRLPRFMRRRASSHDPKRVPKSVRQSVITKINQTLKQSKVKKKFKKKFINKTKIESSIKRRNDKKERSVLHVWFAKRFKMELKWNYLLPQKNTTKNQRILYHNSKNECVFYYLSFCHCIQIDYKLSNSEQLINYLSHFTHSDVSFGFGAKVYEMGNREGITVLYDFNSYPFKAIASCNFLWNQNFSKLWLWVHISVYEQVFQLLTDCLTKVESENKFEFIRLNGHLERFRLIGPKAHQLLSNCLKYDLTQKFKSDQTSTHSVHYFKYNETESSFMNSCESNLFKDSLETDSTQKSSAEFELLVIIKNNVFNKRFSTDLIVSSESAKPLWHTLTQNKSHKVGGIIDFEMIALNTSSLLFPNIGFIDKMSDQKKLETLRDVSDSDKLFYVIRNEAIISRLAKNMNLLTINNILSTIEYKNFALINVELCCVSRGVPKESDYICIPTENEIENFLNNRIVENLSTESNKCSVSSERKIIGLIEFGEYSMEISRGKALGVITITGFKQLIELNEKFAANNTYKNNILAFVKSIKSSKYRIVSLKVIDCVLSA